MDETDASLIQRTLAGDNEAFATLALRHRSALVRGIHGLIGDADEAESLAQETLARALAQLATFRLEARFDAWLHGIAANLCRNHLRRRARHAKPVGPEIMADAADPIGRRQGVLSGILRQEQNRYALTAIEQLPTALREAFCLHFIDGLDYTAMSERTGVAPGTLRVRAHRARTLLRRSLGSVVDTWLRRSGDGS
jgi:RNA polymerase sigma-70 factor (ECF subfamily)